MVRVDSGRCAGPLEAGTKPGVCFPRQPCPPSPRLRRTPELAARADAGHCYICEYRERPDVHCQCTSVTNNIYNERLSTSTRRTPSVPRHPGHDVSIRVNVQGLPTGILTLDVWRASPRSEGDSSPFCDGFSFCSGVVSASEVWPGAPSVHLSPFASFSSEA